MEEVWTQIKESQEYYEVSNIGNVRSWIKEKLKEPYVLKKRLSKHGYYRISLIDETVNNMSNQKKHYVHRLVAQAFIPNPKNKPYINHIDGNKINNHVSNLEWCNQSENMLHAYKNGLRPSISDYQKQRVSESVRGEKSKFAKLKRVQVIEIRKHAKENKPHYGRKKLSDKYNVTEETIKNIVNFKTWKHVCT